MDNQNCKLNHVEIKRTLGTTGKQHFIIQEFVSKNIVFFSYLSPSAVQFFPHTPKQESISDVSSGIIHKLLDSGGLYFQETEQEMQRSTSLGAE